MVDPEEMQDRHTRQLAELAELGMSLARDLEARAEAVTALAEAEGLALAFHRISRSVRLTLALESRLAREQGEVRRLQRNRVRQLNEVRAPQVRHALTRDIWNETDGEEAEALLEDLEDLLDEDVLFGRLLEGPVEAAIARLRADLGLTGEAPEASPETPPETRIEAPRGEPDAGSAQAATAPDGGGPDGSNPDNGAPDAGASCPRAPPRLH